MRVFWMLVAGVFFLGGCALFAYSFGADLIFAGGESDFPFESLMFFGGVLAVAVAFMIPFHLLEHFD